jgi:hypothetical protein
MSSPLAFRNVVRYVRDVSASVPLYEALGFQRLRGFEGMAIMKNESGVSLVLHGSVDEHMPAPDPVSATALGFTMVGNDVPAARAFVEKAGWRLLRAPDASDEGFFYIYGDLDGNPINLVGERRR